MGIKKIFYKRTKFSTATIEFKGGDTGIIIVSTEGDEENMHILEKDECIDLANRILNHFNSEGK